MAYPQQLGHLNHEHYPIQTACTATSTTFISMHCVRRRVSPDARFPQLLSPVQLVLRSQGSDRFQATTMSAATLLTRLNNVRQTAPDRWLARCPAHEDRSPSLSVRELNDGRVLLHDFGGCETADVLAALGLTVSDLFERPFSNSRAFGPTRNGIPPRDLLVILDHELTVVVLILNDIVCRRTVSESQVQRLVRAACRIGRARDAANPARISNAA
jgi:hypothetical protein